MRKPIIGIAAPRNINEKRPFKNYTKFVSSYSKMIKDAGGIAIGLLFPDGKFNVEVANLCDGFLIAGGFLIEKSSLNIINYAIKNNKPVLGICLGMQTMAGYEWFVSRFGENISYDMIDKYYNLEFENIILENHIGHNRADPFYFESINSSKHEVILDKSSRIYNIYKNKKICMPSIHNQVVRRDIIKGIYFRVTGKSNDGVTEVIESVNSDLWLVGVQFHPELEDKNIELFNTLINEAKLRQ